MQGDLVCSSHRIEHNGKNKILNGYHMNEINHFKVLFIIMQNDVAGDVGRMLTLHEVIGC
jgi:hypothetical protein